MAGLMATSERTQAKRRLPGLLLPVSLREALPTLTSTGDPLTLAGRSGSVSCGVTDSFPWILVCTRFCLCPPRLESLFPPALWKSCNQIPLASKVRSPSLEACCEAQNLHNNGRTSSVMCSPVCGLPTQRGWDLILL